MNQESIPREWYCPICQQVMKDPVMASDGFTYEHRQISVWLQKSNISPMTGLALANKTLIQNHALRQTIEHYFEKNQSLMQQKGLDSRPCQPQQETLKCEVDTIIDPETRDYYVRLDLIPPVLPSNSKRSPCSIICIVDVSGSMDTDSVMGGKSVESHGFSRLDLVKHSINTMIEFMEPCDELAVVAFNNSAKLVLPLTRTSKAGKTMIRAHIKNLEASGTTNIWDGLKISIELLKNISHRKSKCSNCFVVLLTDGQPNLNPPRGIVPTFKKYLDIQKLPIPNVHVFGYGYELDTSLLMQIAEAGNGTYTYIPDCSMVGTAFVNFMSTALATITNQITLQLQLLSEAYFKDIIGLSKNKCNLYHLGTIQYGQHRHIILRFSERVAMGGIDKLGTATIEYRSQQDQSIVVDINIKHHPADEERMQTLLIRASYLQLLRELVDDCKPNLKQRYQQIDQFYHRIKKKHEEKPTEFTGALSKELKNQKSENEGQVSKSYEKQQWYEKWGKHYIPSLYLAHAMQTCTNFKDPALQLYGGPQFEDYRNSLDTIFIKMAPPEPTAKKVAKLVYKPVPVDMSDYYDYGGGCIAGSCVVKLAGGKTKRVKDLKKGDRIWSGDHKQGTVQCLVETRIFGFTRMVQIGSLLITPYHPIFYQGSWRFPIDIAAPQTMFIESYFNFVLQNCRSLVCEGISCISLGHELTDNSVVSHQYFGSKIVSDLQRSVKYESGLVRISPEQVRDTRTKQVIGIRLVE